MRVCRSRVRMYGKDAEFYMTPDAERVVWRWPQLWGEIFGGGGGGGACSGRSARDIVWNAVYHPLAPTAAIAPPA